MLLLFLLYNRSITSCRGSRRCSERRYFHVPSVAATSPHWRHVGISRGWTRTARRGTGRWILIRTSPLSPWRASHTLLRSPLLRDVTKSHTGMLDNPLAIFSLLERPVPVSRLAFTIPRGRGLARVDDSAPRKQHYPHHQTRGWCSLFPSQPPETSPRLRGTNLAEISVKPRFSNLFRPTFFLHAKLLISMIAYRDAEFLIIPDVNKLFFQYRRGHRLTTRHVRKSQKKVHAILQFQIPLIP